MNDHVNDTAPRHRAGRRRTLVALVAASLAVATPATASMIPTQWYFGNWTCTIDGRPARMRWFVADAPVTQCQGDTCTSTSGVAIRGSFSDNGSRWVPLRLVSSPPRAVVFRHADGNTWRLDQTGPGRAAGWTTWSGRRFPLSCRR